MRTVFKALLITIAIFLMVAGFMWFIIASPLWLFNTVCAAAVFASVWWLVWANIDVPEADE